MKNKTLHPRINQVKLEEKETHGYTKKKNGDRDTD